MSRGCFVFVGPAPPLFDDLHRAASPTALILHLFRFVFPAIVAPKEPPNLFGIILFLAKICVYLVEPIFFLVLQGAKGGRDL